MKHIYLILGSDNSKSWPRTNAVLSDIRKRNIPSSDFLIIASGCNLFDPNPKETGAAAIKNYLVNMHIPEQNIILEENGLDFLGACIYSFHLIQNQILKWQGGTVEPEKFPEIEIIHTNEKYCFRRSKYIFNKIFRSLISLNPNVNFRYIKAENAVNISFFEQLQLKKVMKKLISKKLPLEELASNRLIKEIGIFEVMYFDIEFMYGLNTIDDFEKYLSILPIYSKLYHDTDLHIEKSLYVFVINYWIKEKN